MIDRDGNDDDDDDIDKLVDVCDKVVKMALTTSVNMKNIAVCEQSDSSSDSDLETTRETKLKVRCFILKYLVEVLRKNRFYVTKL